MRSRFLDKRLVFFLALVFVALAPIESASSQERGVVCVYFKRVNPANPADGFYVQLINRKTTSGKFVLRSNPDPQRAVYVDIGREMKPNERDVIERNLATRIGDMFVSKGEKAFKTIAQYRDLFNLLAASARVFQQVDLSKDYDVKDTVYLFDFDLAAQNYSIFKNEGRPESLALYRFAMERWVDGAFFPDYKARLSKHDFKGFLEPETVEMIFQTRKQALEYAELNPAQRRLIVDADQKATWSIILAAIGVIVGIFSFFASVAQSKERTEQIKRLEGKVKNLENRLNKPFYQSGESDEERQPNQLLKSLVARVIALEKAAGMKISENGGNLRTFKNETAAKTQSLIQAYRQKWAQDESLAGEFARLSLCLDDMLFRLGELEEGASIKDFVFKHVIPHIDAIDGVFQAEPDAPINTPPAVNDYIVELQRLFSLSEIEVRAKVSRFDNERHEKAGAILKTNLAAGTITKVLRRGLVHGETIRKAQVIRAE
ncbi:MAG: hypothetical protein NZM06_02380 [Chloroherpetonaceae bacterium]|nr:hypothetical protein [Chloroherpetonaceae bacterium]MDW8436526.1 hypothetical protein [Chloroherpetonaceae bacterium]